MCGSTNNARSAAFASALAFFAEQGAKQIGDKAPEGPTRQHIAYVQSAGGGEPPAAVVALADAEDAVLTQVREVQLAQQGIIERLLKGYRVDGDGQRVEALVASLNNLKDTIAVAEKAQAVYDEEGQKNEDAIKALLASLGASDADPILQ